MASENRNKKGLIALSGALILAALIPIAGLYMASRASASDQAEIAGRLEKAEALWNAKDTVDLEANDQLALEKNLTQRQKAVISAREQSIPGIVCWGDSITAGIGGEGTTYSATLKELLRTELNAAFNRLLPADFTSQTTYDLSIPVVNMGIAGESSLTVAGRSGAIPYIVTEAFTIPADENTSVRVRFESERGEAVEPLVRGSMGLGYVTIGGIEGKLELRQAYGEESRYAYYFTRTEAGDALDIAIGTQIETAAEQAYNDYFAVIQLGHNGGWKDADDLISQIKAVIAAQSNPESYIVLGLSFGDADELQAVNGALAEAFGEHFIDLWQYMREDGLADAHIEPTVEDTEALEAGLLPDSLTGGAGTYNAEGYRLIARCLQRKLHELGCLDAVNEALEQPQ